MESDVDLYTLSMNSSKYVDDKSEKGVDSSCVLGVR